MATDTEVQTPERQIGDSSVNLIESKQNYPSLYRLSVDQYHQIAQAGIIHSGAPVELIEGLLVRKMTIKPPHSACCDALRHLIDRGLPDGWYVSSDNPLNLAALDSEPEPDVKVVRGSYRDFFQRQPAPEDCAIVIEVSDSSYHYDRQVKWALYAAAGVPVYWIVDLNRGALEIHAEPSAEGYRALAVLGPADEAPIVLDGREVARLRVAEILP